MNYTSIEQSKKLVALGLDPQTADQYYWAQQRFDGNEYVNTGTMFHEFRDYKLPEQGEFEGVDNEEHFQYLEKTFGASGRYDDDDDSFIPCWSVGAMLNIIPSAVLARIDDENLWYCNTIRFGDDYFSYDGSFHDNPIDACIEAIEWLIENGHIERKEL